MRRYLITFSILSVLLASGFVFYTHYAEARIQLCGPLTQDTGWTECEEVVRQAPGDPPEWVTINWGCNSDGKDRDCEYRYSFSQGAGQVYRYEYREVRNDNPTPRVYWCINNTGVFGTGACGDVQRDFNRQFNKGGIPLNDAQRYRYFMIHIRVEQKFFNTNDFVGAFTIFRRETTLSNVSADNITVGSPGRFYWTAQHTTPANERAVSIDGPMGYYHWDGANDGVPEDASAGWDTPIALTAPGTYSVEISMGGPSRFDDFQRVQQNTSFTVSASSTCNGNGVCDAGESSTTCPSDCGGGPPVNGRNKCENSTCVFVPGGSGVDQCSPVGAACRAGRNKCENNTCVFVPNDSGPDQCQTNGDCGGGAGRNKCENNTCVFVPGDSGPDQCNPVGTACSGGPGPQTHTICSSGACVSVPGGGFSQCATNSDCPQPTPTCSYFTAAPNRLVIPPPAQSTLSWSCENVDTCSISPGVGSVSAQGTAPVSPTETTTYTLTCTGAGGQTSVQTSLDLLIRVFQFVGGALKEIIPR